MVCADADVFIHMKNCDAIPVHILLYQCANKVQLRIAGGYDDSRAAACLY